MQEVKGNAQVKYRYLEILLMYSNEVFALYYFPLAIASLPLAHFRLKEPRSGSARNTSRLVFHELVGLYVWICWKVFQRLLKIVLYFIFTSTLKAYSRRMLVVFCSLTTPQFAFQIFTSEKIWIGLSTFSMEEPIGLRPRTTISPISYCSHFKSTTLLNNCNTSRIKMRWGNCQV